MSFSCQKGEFDRFFNRLDPLVEESRPDRQPDRFTSLVPVFRSKLVRGICLKSSLAVELHFISKKFLRVIRKNVSSSKNGIPCHLPNWKFCVIQIGKVTLEFLFQSLEMKFSFQLNLTFKIYPSFPQGCVKAGK